MRPSSFEKPVGNSANGAAMDADIAPPSDRRDRIGALLVAVTAFICWYQRGNPPSGVTLESSWFDVLARAFTQGWQWGSDIVFTYGPLGFLTPYVTWNPETTAVFRIGQILLCLLWAAMAYVFARRLGTLRQVLIVAAMVALYPLLRIDIGWNVPFAFAVVLIYRMVDEAPHRAHRTAWYVTVITLLSLLALIKFTGQVMWIGVMGYATLLGLQRRDYRTALIFGLVGPAIFLAIWLAIGQSISGLGAYFATSLNMSTGYAAMSLQPGPHMDMIGMVAFVVLATIIVIGYWLAAARLAYSLTAIALLTMSLMAWKAGYVRPDDHVVIFYGSAIFIALASLCLPYEPRRKLIALRWLGFVGLAFVCLTVSYRFLDFDWETTRMSNSLSSLLHPGTATTDWAAHWAEQKSKFQLPRTQARVGRSKVDVLMNEQSIALANGLNYQPRPAFQGYSAYTPALTRRNEAFLFDPRTAPDFLLTKLQSIDNRFPTADDPLSVLAALRAYLPVDLEGGYLVMQRTGWPIEPLPVPPATAWKIASLGSDLDVDQGPKPQALFFDIQLNVWGQIRGALLREPGLSMHVKLTDGSEHSYALIRHLGLAGMLVSPFMLTESDYLSWHASISERRVISMQLRATDAAEIRWFDPIFAYALTPVELPRVSAATLSPELKNILYPKFTLVPTHVETTRQEVVSEGGSDVLFVHAPATLTFAPDPGTWSISGKYGLLSSAYDCQASDGVALIAERVAAKGKVTQLLARAIDPVHKNADRGAQAFETESFSVGSGDKILLRSAPGLSNNAGTECDWSYLGGITFARTPARQQL